MKRLPCDTGNPDRRCRRTLPLHRYLHRTATFRDSRNRTNNDSPRYCILPTVRQDRPETSSIRNGSPTRYLLPHSHRASVQRRGAILRRFQLHHSDGRGKFFRGRGKHNLHRLYPERQIPKQAFLWQRLPWVALPGSGRSIVRQQLYQQERKPALHLARTVTGQSLFPCNRKQGG